MKVLQVHGKDFPDGGSAISMYRLHHGLRKAGVDSRILCNLPTQPTSVAIPRAWRVENMISGVTMRLGLNDVHCVGAFRIKRLPAFQEADVVNFQVIHGQFFSYLALPALTAEKPAVFTVRDMWPLTGHCAVNYDCERWRTGCGSCPYPMAPPPVPGRDGTALEWKLKRWAYRHSRMTVVALSRRMTEQLQQSILGHLPIVHIPNGVDTEAYRPLERAMCRTALEIPMDKKVLLFGAGHLNRTHKGAALLVKALRGLPARLQKDLVLLLMGADGDVLAGETDLDVRSMGYIGGARLKRLLYSAADLFVLPTLGEGLPNVLLESMACGIPMVSFDVGGVPDLVRHGVTGYLAAPTDADDFRRGVLALLEDEAGREAMAQHCRDIAVKEYDVAYEVQRYIDLYRRVQQA
ncbi:MAG TPA: glycosyltransferase [Methylomirabilota bacterium]|jgi:glycosyltransferase involved in cell wall biosynthesis